MIFICTDTHTHTRATFHLNEICLLAAATLSTSNIGIIARASNMLICVKWQSIEIIYTIYFIFIVASASIDE